MALVERLINLTFTLGEGNFGNDGENTAKVSGLRVSARINKAGGPQPAKLALDVWGLTPPIMRHLSTLGLIAKEQRRNVITVDAGDATNGVATVFIGTITYGYGNYEASPQVTFHVEAGSGVLEALIPNDPISIAGSADVVTVLSGIARKMNVVLESNGVQKRLSNMYLPHSSLRDQAAAVVDQAGLEWNGIDLGVLAIWEPGSSRGGQIPLISKDTGLQGYPAFTSNGVMVKTLFNPNVTFGGMVEVQSSRPELVGANGQWKVYGLDYSLDANMPGGEWSMLVQGAPLRFGQGLPTPTG